MSKSYILIIASFVSLTTSLFAQQEFALLEQFNGRYDFTFVGNTMNYVENGTGAPCIIQTSSSAELSLQVEDQIERVYLYWSGSGSGDLNIKLNDSDIEPDRYFSMNYIASGFSLDFFVAITDVTSQILSTGNGTYTVSELDVSELFFPSSPYCQVATNYAGWALVIVYKNEQLPLNQLNVYEGFKNVPEALSITLDNLNVIDNIGAKIGFVAWEGDSSIAVNETLRINGNILGNPLLNPVNNAFNGTNSITGDSDLYNMDLDIYDIQNNIQIGDTTAEIQLTSGQDLVMISTVVTKLNSQLPDATLVVNQIQIYCDATEIEIDYTVFNLNATDILPAETPIAIYINGALAGITQTVNDIPIGGSENGLITVLIPENVSEEIEIRLVVDDTGNGSGIVTEINENNNEQMVLFELMMSPEYNPLEDLTECNIGHNTAVFDFSEYEYAVRANDSDFVSFHTSYQEASQNINPISDISSYAVQNDFPKEIFVRIANEYCFSITSFFLNIRKCPPLVYNGVSANNDGYNDHLIIDGLYDIFMDFELYIYSRWGELIWKGNNNTPKWKGEVNQRNSFMGGNAPTGTYYYILELNDKDYPTPLQGYLYLTQ